MTFRYAALTHSRDRMSQVLSRRVWSIIFLTIGIVTTFFGILTAPSGFGFIFLMPMPLWFILAAILRPTRPSIALACVFTGFWIYGVIRMLTD